MASAAATEAAATEVTTAGVAETTAAAAAVEAATGVTGETRVWLEDAEAASVRAQGLTRQLLTFARGGAPVRRVVDLGPEGGSGGGTIVVAGTPEQVAEHAASHTGRFLRDLLARERVPA